MIRQEFTINSVNWRVIVWYAVDCYHADEIIDDLIRIGCRGDELKIAKQNLWSCKYDNGITFSNDTTRSSVVVIGLAESPWQYHNTITHERGHLAAHIAKTFHLDPFGEDIRYIEGEAAQKMWKYEHLLICPRCKNKLKKYIY